LVAEIADASNVRPERARIAFGLARTCAMPTLVRLLERELALRASGYRLAIDALVEAIVIELLRAAPQAPGGPCVRDPRIAIALDAIETRYAEPLTIDELARSVRMSRFHFSRLFRDEVGQPPHQWLVRVRVARAAELLRRGHRSVTEAAFEVGFYDLGR